MSLEWILFGLRLLATFILTLFLGVAFYLIWRQLRQTEAQQTTRPAPSLDQLRVVAAGEGQSLAAGQALVLQPVMILGCDPERKFVVDPSASLAEQVRLIWQDGRWWLENLNQSDQIKLNREFLSKSQPLAHGDVISVGDIEFRFETAQ